ncbi:MAG: hypothetical protein ACMUIL_08345 [bacterium]
MDAKPALPFQTVPGDCSVPPPVCERALNSSTWNAHIPIGQKGERS